MSTVKPKFAQLPQNQQDMVHAVRASTSLHDVPAWMVADIRNSRRYALLIPISEVRYINISSHYFSTYDALIEKGYFERGGQKSYGQNSLLPAWCENESDPLVEYRSGFPLTYTGKDLFDMLDEQVEFDHELTVTARERRELAQSEDD